MPFSLKIATVDLFRNGRGEKHCAERRHLITRYQIKLCLSHMALKFMKEQTPRQFYPLISKR